jgi:hypothetical protein
MASYFREPRNIELSIIYYLETQINASWTGVTVIKSFSQAYDVSVPVVCIRLFNQNTRRLEIGDNILRNDYYFIIDVFAKSDGQRIDLSDFIVDKIKDGCIYYEWSHASGSNTTMERVANGRIRWLNFTENSKVDFGQDVDSQDRFRHLISFNVSRE